MSSFKRERGLQRNLKTSANSNRLNKSKMHIKKMHCKKAIVVLLKINVKKQAERNTAPRARSEYLGLMA